MEENIIKTKLEELLPNCEVQAWHPTHFISVLTGDTIRPTHAQPGRGQLIRHRAGISSTVQPGITQMSNDLYGDRGT